MTKPRSILIATGAVGCLFLALAGVASAAGTFDDDNGNTHESAIEAIAAAGITKGCNPPTNSEFCPDRAVTRAEMATFLQRAFDLAKAGSGGFGDISSSVHKSAIDSLAAAGVTKGCNPPANDRYCPDEPVTRAQMATFLTRTLGLTDNGGGDLFDDDDGSVHEADIDRLGTAGITKGCNPPSNTRYCPDEPVTRAQMATFLARALGLKLIDPLPNPGPGDDQAALVSRFSVTRAESSRVIPYWVRNMGYWPRSFKPGLDVNGVPGNEGWQVDRVDDPGQYRGWDALSPANSWGFNEYGKNNQWMQFDLTRPAKVAVVWRDDGPRPSWLQSGWSQGGTVQIDGRYAPVYVRDYPAGRVKLGTVEGGSGNSKTMYLILLAEADGKPTPAPDTPGNRALPTPGEECPDWVHNRHVTTGPDGKTYETWHPQWDPVYWCSFGHEHGSNPGLIPGSPKVPYGYIAARLGQDEPNAGFKEFTFRDLSSRNWVRFVIHAGTAMHRRVCAQFHTLYVQVYDPTGKELMNVGFKADYGDPVAVRDAGPLTPSCTTPGYNDNDRVREINVSGLEHSYERWEAKFNTTATRNLGFGDFQHGFDIRNPMTQCVNMTCNSVERIDRGDPTNENASRRTIDMSGWQAGFSFNVAQALDTGEFYSDPYGLNEVSASASNSVRQFIDPGVQSTDFLIAEGVNTIMCNTEDPWTMYYDCIEMRNNTPFPHQDDMQIMFSLTEN